MRHARARSCAIIFSVTTAIGQNLAHPSKLFAAATVIKQDADQSAFESDQADQRQFGPHEEGYAQRLPRTSVRHLTEIR
jgi:hypothetical protein